MVLFELCFNHSLESTALMSLLRFQKIAGNAFIGILEKLTVPIVYLLIMC